MAHQRDMSLAQFIVALARHGMTSEGFMGYVRMPIIGGRSHCCVSYLNAPSPSWRSRLAYLLAKKEEIEREESNRIANAKAGVR